MATKYCIDIWDALKIKMPGVAFKFGGIFYRDSIDFRFKEGVLPKKLKTDSIKFTESNKQYIISPKQLNINE